MSCTIRTVDRRAVAIAFGVIGAVVLASCSSPPASNEAAGEIDRTATLRVAGNVVPNNLDPHQSGNYQIDFPFLSPVYDRLTQAVSGPEIVPMVAQSWLFSDDGRSVDFSLRGDATFHDGTPVDAAAVVASLNRARDPQRSKVAGRFDMISGIEAIDDTTVRIGTNRPAMDLPAALSTTEGAIVNVKAIESGLDINTTGAGSGPYEFDQVRPGDRITYTRHDGYWDPEAQKPARLELIGIADDNSRLNAFRSGQVDAVKVDPDQYHELGNILAQPGFKFHEYPTVQSYAIQLDIGTPGLADPRVRQALNYAIDREGINSALLDGKCAPLSQPLPVGVDGHDTTRTNRYTYDPGKARALLREANASPDLTIRVINVAGASPQQEMATAVQAQLADVGVKVVLQPIPAVDAQSTFRKGGYGLLNSRLAYPIPGQSLMLNYMADYRFPTPPSAEFSDTVFQSMDPSISDSDRTSLYVQASAIAADDAYDVFICGVPTMVAYSSKTVGMDSLGQSDFTSIFDLRYAGVTTS
ncbi:UNVERIFIED_ORG: peptide/nickel transport system substrate-binding protein [Nocardia globerula]|uniref:Peptide/nickel transport system substrate-binding protein n=1 Tax=Nocardia globerula TaxID=1818 RepID=A0A652YSP8_NOCGL|nr:ABC transporter substrate-binding protein [Rhodococcus globerulus]NMD61346.1 ABC transporter substrate-binding protein [Nocardia globerula]PVX67102.1 peptide/nickel transport system substrate-binding protein [Rhodococcus globerulus]